MTEWKTKETVMERKQAFAMKIYHTESVCEERGMLTDSTEDTEKEKETVLTGCFCGLQICQLQI